MGKGGDSSAMVITFGDIPEGNEVSDILKIFFLTPVRFIFI